jgi:hypothetical protein
MVAQKQDTALTLDCKVECREKHYFAVGTFQIPISSTFDVHELDQIEAEIEIIGQEFKRQLTRHVLEAADRRIVEVVQIANTDFHKHGTRPFSIVARYGTVTFQRQRLLNPKKKEKKTLIPSAIAWNTSNHRHLTAGLIDAACKESQQVAYRTASQNLADTSGQESLIAASTVWNKKQQRGKELKSKQKQCVDKIMKQYEPLLVEHNIMTPSTTAPSPDEVELFSMTPEQEDEVDELFESFTQYQYKHEPQHVLSEHVTMPLQETEMDLILENTASEHSIVSEKRLEVLSDGARWIATWATGIVGMDVVAILCWCHLCKRVYEGLSGLGLAKEAYSPSQHTPKISNKFHMPLELFTPFHELLEIF